MSKDQSIPENVKHWNPVRVSVEPVDTVGVVALTIISLALLIINLRLHRELREMQAQVDQLRG